MVEFDRTTEDVGNIVTLEHVNTRVPDQQLATVFYVMGLGLTRDPYIMTGTSNMWINAGRSQFHLPTGPAQVLRGHSGLVLPGREALLQRLSDVKPALADTEFSFAEENDYVEVISPWGNRIRCFEPGAQFGDLRLGIPYVELDVAPGTTAAIAKFYRDIVGAPATQREDQGQSVATVAAGIGQTLIFRETDAEAPAYDDHHVAIYLADFSGPYNRLMERGLINRETNQHEYRFQDIIDLDYGTALFRLEHEVRSMRHPMYARPLVNRDPAITNQSYAPGYQDAAWSMAVSD